MTDDTKKSVENKGAATEQVALNKWCHPIGAGFLGAQPLFLKRVRLERAPGPQGVKSERSYQIIS